MSSFACRLHLLQQQYYQGEPSPSFIMPHPAWAGSAPWLPRVFAAYRQSGSAPPHILPSVFPSGWRCMYLSVRVCSVRRVGEGCTGSAGWPPRIGVSGPHRQALGPQGRGQPGGGGRSLLRNRRRVPLFAFRRRAAEFFSIFLFWWCWCFFSAGVVRAASS